MYCEKLGTCLYFDKRAMVILRERSLRYTLGKVVRDLLREIWDMTILLERGVIYIYIYTEGKG